MIWNGAKEEDHKSAGANGLSSTAPPPAPPPAHKKTKALSIIYQSYVDELGKLSNTWLFFETNQGVSAVCTSEDKAKAKFPTKGDVRTVDNPPWTGGTYAVKGLDGMDCEYKNDGHDTGALWCEGRDVISCREDAAKGKGHDGTMDCDPKAIMKIHKQHPVVFCEW